MNTIILAKYKYIIKLLYQHVRKKDRHENDKHYPKHVGNQRKGDIRSIITLSSLV